MERKRRLVPRPPSGMNNSMAAEQTDRQSDESDSTVDTVCPSCGAPLIQEKCKLVCRSEACVYRIIFNCSEF